MQESSKAERVKCNSCGIHESFETLKNGICNECLYEMKLREAERKHNEQKVKFKENEKLSYGFINWLDENKTLLSFLQIFIFLSWAAWEWRVFEGRDKLSLNIIKTIGITEDNKRVTGYYDIKFHINYEQQFVTALIKSPDEDSILDTFFGEVIAGNFENNVKRLQMLGLMHRTQFRFDDCIVISKGDWQCNAPSFLNFEDAVGDESATAIIGVSNGDWIYNKNIQYISNWRTGFFLDAIGSLCERNVCVRDIVDLAQFRRD